MKTYKAVKYTPLETGTYPAAIEEIKETSGDYGLQLEFEFSVADTDGNYNRTVRQWASPKITLPPYESKLARWLSGIEGVLDENYTFRPDDWVGRLLQISVRKITKDDGKVHARVEGFLPPTKVQVNRSYGVQPEDVPM